MIAGFFNLVWILIGGTFIGIIARLLVPGRQFLPAWATIGSGIAGLTYAIKVAEESPSRKITIITKTRSAACTEIGVSCRREMLTL